MIDRITDARPRTARRRRSGLRGTPAAAVAALLAALGALGALSLFMVAGAVPTGAAADRTSGGTGRFPAAIRWFSWGPKGTELPNAGTTVHNSYSVAGHALVVTCRVSAIRAEAGPVPGAAPARPAGHGGYLSSYLPGTYAGDGLDDLYNVGGPGTANRLADGLYSASGRTVRFDVACSATADGAPYHLDGLVFADAESTNGRESIAATAPAGATWRLIDRYRSAACADQSVLASVDQRNRLTLAPDGQCPTGSPTEVGYLDGATTLTDVALAGSGREAIALGVAVSFDLAATPRSYGQAVHLQQYRFTGGALTVGTGPTRINDSAFALADADVPALVLGTSAQAADALTSPPTVSVLPGDSFSLLTVACSGTGWVNGWIDWNHDGTFTGPEATGAQPCDNGAASLTWTATAAVTSAETQLRLRIGPTPAAVASPTGLASAGEVEQYPVVVAVPQPHTVSDSATTANRTAVSVDVLANDEPAQGTELNPTSLVLLRNGRPVRTLDTPAGSYAAGVDGSIRFRPAAGFHGSAPAVAYRVTDSLCRDTIGWLTVTVAPPAA